MRCERRLSAWRWPLERRASASKLGTAVTDNEAPLAKEDVQRLLSVVGDRAVLVGGQAVAWWAEFYSRQGRLRSVQRPTDLYVSIDADFVPGSLDDIRAFIADVAAQLRGTGTHKFPFTSLLVGSVAYQDSQGCRRSVEFLKTLYGIKKRDVLDGAIPFEAEDLPRIFVVAPIFLTESRVANLIELPAYQNPREILQARVATEVVPGHRSYRGRPGFVPGRYR